MTYGIGPSQEAYGYMNGSSIPTFAYIKISLRTEKLRASCRRELEDLGVQNLQQKGAYEVYGIALDTIEMIEDIETVRDVKRIEFQSPYAFNG